MRKRILAFVFAAALLVAMAVPLFGSGGAVYAHGLPPCNDGSTGVTDVAAGATGANYAKHHIASLAKDGSLGGGGHKPGTHQGFSICDPAQTP